MANYGYSTPFQGFQQGLPAGYMQAATDPGRNIGAGIASFGASIGDAIKRFQVRKQESDYADQKIADLLQMTYSAASSGDEHAQSLLGHVMGITNQKDPESLMKFATDVPSMPLAKKKALAQDLEFSLKRYDENRINDAKIRESDAAVAYRDQLTKQLEQELALKQNSVTAENAIANLPIEYNTPQDTTGSVTVNDENGNVLASGPGRQVAVTKQKPFSDFFREAASIGQKHGVPVDPEKVSALYRAKGGQIDLPEGMVPTGMTIKTPGGVVQLENLDAATQQAILKQQSEFLKQKALIDYQQKPEVAKKTVTLPDGRAFVARSEKAADKLSESIEGFTYAGPAIDRLIEISNQFGESMSPSLREEASKIATTLKAKLRVPIAGPGTMSNQDQKLLDQLVNNPVGFFTWDYKQRKGLESLKGALKSSFEAQLKSEGVDLNSEMKKKVWNPDTNSWE